MPEDVAREHYQEWLDAGKPSPRDGQGGFADPGLLEILFPWWITPSNISTGTLWGPGTPYPTSKDFDASRSCRRQ